VNAYFREIVRRFSPSGFSKDRLIPSILDGTKAMIQNDGSRLNADVFWDTFAASAGEKVRTLLPEFE
jgi:hypothetical protein